MRYCGNAALVYIPIMGTADKHFSVGPLWGDELAIWLSSADNALMILWEAILNVGKSSRNWSESWKPLILGIPWNSKRSIHPARPSTDESQYLKYEAIVSGSACRWPTTPRSWSSSQWRHTQNTTGERCASRSGHRETRTQLVAGYPLSNSRNS